MTSKKIAMVNTLPEREGFFDILESVILRWMLTKKIDSLQHPLVKRWVKLRTERSYREETQAVLVVGKKIINELQTKILISNRPGPNVEYLVTDEILKKITGLHNPDGFAAEVILPKPQMLLGKKYIIILDRISDPGNLGTLLRTALALNWEGVIVTPDTVDLFNDKALRAAKGATFRLPYTCMTHEEIADFLKKNSFHAYTADIEGDVLGTIRFKAPIALILSNESSGPTHDIGKKITIPMSKSAESLNVAAAGAILLYSMRSL
jgi:TrmH family RNA methyltransferase